MTRVRTALLVLSLLTLVTFGSGYTYREQHALNIARAAWGTLPCDGNIIMERVDSIAFNRTQWWQEVDGQAISPCTIEVTYDAIEQPWVFYCPLVVHEVGHLLGYKHSSDPRNVMYPAHVDYWRCRPNRVS